MSYNIGINVIEVDGSAPPTIVGASVSIAAFNILTQRGLPNHPVRVTSFNQFVENFGGYFSGGLGAYLVKGFFDNGGQRAYINRVVAPNAPVASRTLQDGASRNTLTLETGFRGQEDPGSWANDLFVRVQHSSSASSRLRETAPASVQGSALTPPVNMSALPPLRLRVDGETALTEITFAASDFTNAGAAALEEIRNAINRRTTKLIASIDGNRIVLTSAGQIAALRKDWTSLQITENNAALGFTTMANPNQGATATLNASSVQLASVSDFAVGDALRISDGTRTAFAKVLRIIPTSQTIEWTPDLSSPAPATFDARLTRISNVEFDLTIASGGTEDDQIVETWTGLSMEPDALNYAPTILNNSLNGSRYLVLTDNFSSSSSGQDIPAVQGFTRLNPTSDSTPTANDFIGNAAQHSGFYAFDPYDVQLVCCERTDPAIVREALTYCSRRSDCLFVGSVPEGYVAGGQAIAYGQTFQGKNVYGALYGPWIKVFDPIGTGDTPMKWIPPTGHILGMYARIANARGVWKAPAGDEAELAGALDVETRLSDTDHTDLVKSGSVNGVRAIPGAGIIVDASRTLSTDTRWLYVNVRLLFNFVKSSLKEGLRWTRQEPNRSTLWDVIKYNTVSPFLLGLWRQGAFGTGTPEQVFTVICDATNNPPTEVDKGNLKVEVYFYPAKPAETIVIIVGQQPSGASVSES
jgi:phage tail sheath protein FI